MLGQSQTIQQQHQGNNLEHSTPNAAHATLNGQANGSGPSTSPGPIANAMSEAQITMLKNQILAFKLLNKNLPIRKHYCTLRVRQIH